jgi:uncharacterized protein YbbC (DUF1343 family)
MNTIQIGMDRIQSSPPTYLKKRRLGLLANPASVNRRFIHSRVVIDQLFPGQLNVLFSPQHGFYAEKQDNMIASNHGTDPVLNIPVFSLYGETRKPTESMLSHIDTLIVDLQDVGTRVYTFVYTMALCMEAAREYDKEIVVLDRPNPVGGEIIEGNLLNEAYASFVGMYPIPMRHGLTIGELARLFNEHFDIACPLHVVAMKGWKRNMLFHATGLPWVAPSPNLPTPVSSYVYPGQVLWEGTNVSEGRGTTQPFDTFGAPFMDPESIQEALSDTPLEGIHLRPLAFEPTSNKWAGERCYGFQIHLLDPTTYRPYFTTLALLRAVLTCHADAFQWKAPPYEYEFEKLPFDCITGDPAVRETLEADSSLQALEKAWQPDLDHFNEVRRSVLLY